MRDAVESARNVPGTLVLNVNLHMSELLAIRELVIPASWRGTDHWHERVAHALACHAAHQHELGRQCLLQAYFRPELLNRLDETVVFRQLSRVDIATISQLVLQQTSDRLADKGVRLNVSQAVLARIQEEGYDEVGWML